MKRVAAVREMADILRANLLYAAPPRFVPSVENFGGGGDSELGRLWREVLYATHDTMGPLWLLDNALRKMLPEGEGDAVQGNEATLEPIHTLLARLADDDPRKDAILVCPSPYYQY